MSTAKYELIERRKVYSGRIFDVFSDTVRIPTGAVVARDVVTHPGAVVVLPQNENGELLLIRQYRHAIAQTILEFPAGTLEPEEEPLACAKREIAEETGFSAAVWIALGTVVPAPGFCGEIQHLYLARELAPMAAAGDDDEIIELAPMNCGEVERAVVDGRIIDAKTIAIFARARLGGLL